MKRYRRLKTILNKAVETADSCGLHLNVLVYDPKFHRFKENYTSTLVKLESLKDLANDQPKSTNSSKKNKVFKFYSIDARTLMQDDYDSNLPLPFKT